MNDCNSGPGVQVKNNFPNAVQPSSEMSDIISRLNGIHERMEESEKRLIGLNLKLHGPTPTAQVDGAKNDGPDGCINMIHAIISRIESTLGNCTDEINALERL